MYVSDLIDELKRKLDVVEGTLYPLLTRLKNGEFLAYRWGRIYQWTSKENTTKLLKEENLLAELQNTWNMN